MSGKPYLQPGFAVPSQAGVAANRVQFVKQAHNPFDFAPSQDLACLMGSQAAQNYCQGMSLALGKKVQYSEADFEKYETILKQTCDMLDETIDFCARANSPATNYQEQKAMLQGQLNMTQVVRLLINEGKKALGGSGDSAKAM